MRQHSNTYEIVDAALRLDRSSTSFSGSFADTYGDLDLSVDVWGPGWRHWDKDLPLSENVRKRSWKGQAKRDRKRQEEIMAVQQGKIKWERDDEKILGWSSHANRSQDGKPPGATGMALSLRESELFDLSEVGRGCPADPFDMVWTFSCVCSPS